MRNNPEHNLCRAIATYLHLQYPKVLFHYDLAGLNLSKAQAGMMKSIQGGTGWPDLFIAEPRGRFHGLFIEVKPEGTNITKVRTPEYATPHIADQASVIGELEGRGYAACFCCGFNEAQKVIDAYLLQK